MSDYRVILACHENCVVDVEDNGGRKKVESSFMSYECFIRKKLLA